MPKLYMDIAIQAQQWERAKGELRALIAIQGSYAHNPDVEEMGFVKLRKKVDAFIEDVEKHELHLSS